jgi:hypothetical protein
LTKTILHIVTARYVTNKVHDHNSITFTDLPDVIRAMKGTRLKREVYRLLMETLLEIYVSSRVINMMMNLKEDRCINRKDGG